MPALCIKSLDACGNTLSITKSNMLAAEVPLLRICDEVNGQDTCQTGLLEGIARGLLQPSVPLSAQAAEKLQQRRSDKHGTQQKAGQLLKSLPVELLYDDTGLQLFDQITYLPEYYLTEAEASILEAAGADIVASCVRNGALLLELGAGSMRKTRLLLEAVERAGCQDVTFAALDLCEDSLSDALTALQGCCGSSINMVGLVGTYDQGLQYIWDQNSQHTSKQKQQQQPPLQQQQCTTAAAAAAPAGPEEDSDEDCELVSGPDSPVSGPVGSTLGQADSALGQVLFRDGSIGASSMDSRDSSSHSTDIAVDIAASLSAEDEGITHGAACSGREREGERLAGVWGRPKVIMWLGSSIGNCNREQAVGFLQQVKDKAMSKGDFLLIGIDRRNATEIVSAAYNDKQGITRKFILNGLDHCCRLLDTSLPKPNHLQGGSAAPSLTTTDFEYFCLYNDDLGRHEAYYQATTNTVIKLPAAVATQFAAGNISTASPGTVSHGVSTAAGSSESVVDVPIAAGELISVEFSYKYSQQEVEQLAASAELQPLKAWNDAQQRYDLHLLQCRD